MNAHKLAGSRGGQRLSNAAATFRWNQSARRATVTPHAETQAPTSAGTADGASSPASSSSGQGTAQERYDEILKGRMTYKPETFSQIVSDAADALVRGINDGITEAEVEFPPIASADSYKTSSDVYIDANTQFAIEAGRKIFSQTGKRTVVVLPDGGELDRSSKLFKSTLDMIEGVSMSQVFEGHGALKSLGKLFGGGQEQQAQQSSPAREADVHLVINITTKDLPEVQQYQQQIVKDGAALCFFNCELDTLRGDLGQFTFPPKATHYQWMSKFKPVFYIRQRDYSKTINRAPFVVNYSGCLFREYPGPWQVMLRKGDGEYACVAEDPTRYTLGEVKVELMEAMGLNTEAEGSRMQFLRRGYKTTTWWEDDDEQEKFDAWRT